MAIYDTLNFMQCDVVTYCIGMAASMSTVLLAAGTPWRYALPNSRVMIHQPSGGAGGKHQTFPPQETHAGGKRSITFFLNIAEKLLSLKDSDRDYYMSADEAKDYGLVDEVISQKPVE